MYCDFKFNKIERGDGSTIANGAYFIGQFVDDGDGGTVYSRSERVAEFCEVFEGNLTDAQVGEAMKAKLAVFASDNNYEAIPAQA